VLSTAQPSLRVQGFIIIIILFNHKIVEKNSLTTNIKST